MISSLHSNSILITTTCLCLALSLSSLRQLTLSSPSCNLLLPPSKSTMESQFLDFLKLYKPIIARFRIPKLRPFFDVFLLLGLLSWPLRATAAYATYLFNHHVVFLIGNAIIVMLFLLCRQNHAAAGGGDDEYVKHRHSDAAAAAVPDLPPRSPVPAVGGDEEKQIVACAAEVEVGVGASCEDMAITIEKARRQIKRFRRTKSEKLKREIRATTTTTLRRSETQNRRNSVSSEIEKLSSEEFRRTIDAFIHENWSTKKMKKNQFDEYQKFQMAF